MGRGSANDSIENYYSLEHRSERRRSKKIVAVCLLKDSPDRNKKKESKARGREPTED